LKHNPISKSDPRSEYIVKFDPRIHFGIIEGVLSSPIPRVFGRNIEKELQECVSNFLEEEVLIDQIKKEITIPKLFFYFRKDFDPTPGIKSDILNWVLENLPANSHITEDLKTMISLKAIVKHNSFDFNLINCFQAVE